MTAGRIPGKKEKGNALPARVLTVKQERVIMAVLGSRTISEACKASGITKSTYYLWLKQPAFARELKERREALIAGAMARMEGGLAFAFGKFLDFLPSAAKETLPLRAKVPRGLKGKVAALEQRASRNRPKGA
jgi:hypothetical protein